MKSLTWPQAAVIMVATAAIGTLAYFQHVAAASAVTLMGLVWALFQDRPGSGGGELP